MKKEKISIIIPAYNSEKYIEETLKSIINQTYKNIEIIVIDDGSTDNTKKVIEKVKKNSAIPIQYHYQKNAGQSAARNKGVELVKSKYLSFIDSDDILKKDCIEKLYKAITKEKADISVCGYEKFDDPTGNVLFTRNTKDWEIEFDNNIKHVFQYSVWAKLYRLDFLKKYHIKFSEGEQLEDGPYCALTDLLANKVATLDYIGFRYRMYNTSTMGNVRKKNNKPKPPYNGIKDLIETFNKYNKNPDKKAVMEYCAVKILTGLATNMYKSIDKETRKEVCNYSHEIMKTYFSDISKNPYIRISRLKKLPLSHRVAVRWFIFFDKINLLYPFSLIVSKLL
ncbi:MAG: glycosyltransferase family 2 protein [Bacilli bacterium]|nr:glycosyltransferase family 2 protein [Bacilli bacterium]